MVMEVPQATGIVIKLALENIITNIVQHITYAEKIIMLLKKMMMVIGLVYSRAIKSVVVVSIVELRLIIFTKIVAVDGLEVKLAIYPYQHLEM
jgi:hypothetical protein